MTEKRFKLHIDWFNYDKTDGEATLSDNGQPLLESDCVEDMRRLKDLLNEQHETIQQLKAEIKQLNHDLDLYEENNTNEVLNKLRIELTSRMNDCIEEFKE